MEQVNYFLSNLCITYQSEILDYLDKCHTYIKDLLSFKKIPIYTKIRTHTDFQKRETIKNVISSTNSALNTIGIPLEELVPTDFLFERIYKERIHNYVNYNEFYEKELKLYVNRYLFVSLIEYITEIDKRKVENLDLFDLLPSKFKEKLIHYRETNPISLEEESILINVLQNINHYVDLNSITMILGSFQNPPQDQISLKEGEIIDQLKKAKESALNYINTPIESVDNKYLSKDLEDLRSAIEQLGEEGDTFAHTFGNLHRMKQVIIHKLVIDFQNLKLFLEKNQNVLDLENLFYLVSIGKMTGIDFLISVQQILERIKLFVNARVFSSGVYHKPNPISNAYGLSILSELDLFNKTEIVDPLDIEMYLENEFKNFIPEKLLLNFYSLVALKLLEKRGHIITDKNYLLRELLSLDVSTFPDKTVPLDMLCHLATIKLIQESRDITRLTNIYYTELKNSLQEDNSINHNVTDSARALLVLKLLGFEKPNDEMLRGLLNYLLSNNHFFSDEQSISVFHWQNDPLAFKIELRMLFWICLALSQFEELF